MQNVPTCKKVSVTRNKGTCVCCENPDQEIIFAYDPAIYEGGVCPDCILEKVYELQPHELKLLSPMIFVARGLKGQQPFKDVLDAHDTHDQEKLKSALDQLQKIVGQELKSSGTEFSRTLTESRSILKRLGYFSITPTENRATRRAEASKVRRLARKALRAKKRALVSKGTSGCSEP